MSINIIVGAKAVIIRWDDWADGMKSLRQKLGRTANYPEAWQRQAWSPRDIFTQKGAVALEESLAVRVSFLKDDRHRISRFNV